MENNNENLQPECKTTIKHSTILENPTDLNHSTTKMDSVRPCFVKLEKMDPSDFLQGTFSCTSKVGRLIQVENQEEDVLQNTVFGVNIDVQIHHDASKETKPLVDGLINAEHTLMEVEKEENVVLQHTQFGVENHLDSQYQDQCSNDSKTKLRKVSHDSIGGTAACSHSGDGHGSHKECEKTQEKSRRKTDQVYHCDSCDKTFRTLVGHKRHSTKCVGIPCNTCGKRFYNSRFLRQHKCEPNIKQPDRHFLKNVDQLQNTSDDSDLDVTEPPDSSELSEERNHGSTVMDTEQLSTANYSDTDITQHQQEDQLEDRSDDSDEGMDEQQEQQEPRKRCMVSTNILASQNSPIREHAYVYNKKQKRQDTGKEARSGNVSSDQEEIFHCNDCKKGFYSEFSYEMHTKSCTAKVCKTCGHVFSCARNLKYHVCHRGKLYGCHPKVVENIVDTPGDRTLAQLKKFFTFGCEICVLKFDSKLALQSHLKYQHSKQRKFVCDLCHQSYVSVKCLRRHMSLHSANETFDCEMCGEKFSKCRQLKMHVNVHLKRYEIIPARDIATHRTNSWDSEQSFSEPQEDCCISVNSKNQQESSEEPNNISAEFRDASLEYNKFRNHPQKQQSKGQYADQYFVASNDSSKGNMQQEKQHTPRRDFRILKNDSVNQSDTELSSDQQIPLIPKVIQCIECKEEFLSESGCKIHMESCCGKKCGTCGHEFSRVKSLNRHKCIGKPYRTNFQMTEQVHVMRQLDQLRKFFTFNCDKCARKFDSENALGHHLTDEHSEVPCETCHQMFSPKILRHHVKIEHSNKKKTEKSFLCDVCCRSYPSAKRLRVHMRVHNTKHDCPVCCKETLGSRDLNDHIKFHLKRCKLISNREFSTPKINSGNQLLNNSDQLEDEEEDVEEKFNLVSVEQTEQVCDTKEGVLEYSQSQLQGSSAESQTQLSIDTTQEYSVSVMDKNINQHESSEEQNLSPQFRESSPESDEGMTHPRIQHSEEGAYEQSHSISFDTKKFCASSSYSEDGTTQQQKRHTPRKDSRIWKNDLTGPHNVIQSPTIPDSISSDTEQSSDQQIYFIPKVFQCIVCKEEFLTESRCKRHMKSCCGKTCGTCGYEFSQVRTLHRHKCRGKPYRTNLQKTQQVHARQLDQLRKFFSFNCDQCARKFDCEKALGHHLTGEHSQVPCETCHQMFSPKLLRYHVKGQHANNKNLETPFPCDVCGRAYASARILRTHMNIHNGKGKYDCPVCCKSIISSTVLSKHIKFHLKQYKLVSNRDFATRVTNSATRPLYNPDQLDGAEGEEYNRVDARQTNQLHNTNERVLEKSPSRGPNSSVVLQEQLVMEPTDGYSVSGKDKSLPETSEERNMSATFRDASPVSDTDLTRQRTQHSNEGLDEQSNSISFEYNECTAQQQKQHTPRNDSRKLEELTGENIVIQSDTNQRETFQSRVDSSKRSDSSSKEHVYLIPNIFHCSKCNAAFQMETRCKIHRETCGGKTCKTCGQEFSHPRNLKHHKCRGKPKGNKGKRKKRIIVSQFTAERLLDSHTSEQLQKKFFTFNCGECVVKFDSQEALRHHTREEHTKIPCEICRQEFPAKQLRRHVKIEHTGKAKEEKLIQCGICNQTFLYEDSLKRHMNFHTGKNTYDCRVCCRTFISSNTLKDHIVSHFKKYKIITARDSAPSEDVDTERSTPRQHTAGDRPEEYSRSVVMQTEQPGDIAIEKVLGKSRHHDSTLEPHQQCIEGPNVEQKDQRKTSVERNISTQFHDASPETDECMTQTNKQRSKERSDEQNRNSISRPYTDRICVESIDSGEDTPTKRPLTPRMLENVLTGQSIVIQSDTKQEGTDESANSDKSAVNEIDFESKVLRCSACEKEYRCETRYQIHIKSCAGKTCTICRHKFASAYNMNLHKCPGKPKLKDDDQMNRTLEQLKKYFAFSCDKCTRKFDGEKALGHHLTDEHSEVPCEICPQMFSPKTLRRHVKEHHSNNKKDEKPFPCDVCSRSYISAECLRCHMRVHRRTHDCPVCCKKFVGSRVLSDHLKFHLKRYKFITNRDLASARFNSGNLPVDKSDILGDTEEGQQDKYNRISVEQPGQLQGTKERALHTQTQRQNSCAEPQREELTSSVNIKNMSEISKEHTISAPFDDESHESDKEESNKYTDLIRVSLHDSKEDAFHQQQHLTPMKESGLLEKELTGQNSAIPSETRSIRSDNSSNQEMCLIPNVFHCSKCNAEFQIETRCKIHMKSCGGKTCKTCGHEFSIAINLKHHKCRGKPRAKRRQHIDLSKCTVQSLLDNHTLNELQKSFAFTCDECLLKFDNQEALRHHTREEHTKIPCEICQLEFTAKQLRRHVKIEHTEKAKEETPFRCDICNRIFLYEDSLKRHMNFHNGITHDCKVCCRKFVASHTLKEHIMSHLKKYNRKESTKERSRICNICGKSVNINVFTKHVGGHLILQPYTCIQCDDTFESEAKLMTHARKHTQSLCEICGLELDGNSNNYHKHMLKHKKDDDNINTQRLDDKLEEETCSCDVCGKKLLFSSLKNHMLVHSNERNYKCDECGKTFKMKRNLKTHMKTHGRPTYSCDICGVKSNTLPLLRRHMKGHQKVKRHICHICKKEFRRCQNLADHIIRHSSEKPFQCNLCDKAFHLRDGFKFHLGRHARKAMEAQSTELQL